MKIEASITARERRVWLAICASHSSRRIADAEGITVRGVEYLRSSLCKKLGIETSPGRHCTAALVRAAAEHDLLNELPPLRIGPQAAALAHG
jgi:FixJ family two-component response regulator